MSASLGKIFAQLSIQSSVKGDMARAKMDLDGGLKGMGATSAATLSTLGLAAGAAGAAVAGGVAIGVYKAVTTFRDFEQTVASAAAVTGLVGDEFDKAKAHIAAVSKELGETTSFSAKDAANALYNLASAGQDVSKMTAADLAPILNLASGTQTDLAETTDTVTNVMGQFQMGMDQSGRITDVFARAIGDSKASMDSLAYSFKYAGPIANSLGLSFEKTTALLSTLYNVGFSGEAAGTAVRGSLAALMSPSGDAQAAISALGLTMDQVNPSTRDFTEIIRDLGAAGMTAEQAMAIFGTEAAPAMLALTANADMVDKLTNSFNNASGAAKQMADQNLDTLKGSLDLMSSVLEGALIDIGGALAPGIRVLAQGIADSVPDVKAAIMGIIETFKTFSADLGPTWDNLKAIGTDLKIIFTDLFGAVGADKSTILAGVAGAINLLSGAIRTVLDFAAEHPTLTKFVLAAIALVAGLALLPAVVGAIGAGLAAGVAAVTGFVAAVSAGAGLVITALGLILSPVGLIIAGIALLAIAWKKNWFDIQGKTRTVVNGIKTAFSQLKLAITRIIPEALSKVRTELGRLPDIITGIRTRMYNAGYSIAKQFYDGLKNRITAAINYVNSKLQVLRDLLPSSPAKAGPFRVLPDWNSALAEPLEAGIRNAGALTPQMTQTVQALRAPIDRATAPSGSGVLSTLGQGGVAPGPMTTDSRLLDAIKALVQQAGTGQITIKDVRLDASYNFEALIKDIERYQTARRRQRGNLS